MWKLQAQVSGALPSAACLARLGILPSHSYLHLTWPERHKVVLGKAFCRPCGCARGPTMTHEVTRSCSDPPEWPVQPSPLSCWCCVPSRDRCATGTGIREGPGLLQMLRLSFLGLCSGPHSPHLNRAPAEALGGPVCPGWFTSFTQGSHGPTSYWSRNQVGVDGGGSQKAPSSDSPCDPH